MATDNQGDRLFDVRSVSTLFYVALTQYLAPTSGFSDSRRAVELAAHTQFLNDLAAQEKLTAISRAFDDVGILLN